MEAMVQFGIGNLPARINELRMHHSISDEWKNTINGKKYKRYFIKENKNNPLK
jgi:hypothetical protein